jgi:serine protease inhibitor
MKTFVILLLALAVGLKAAVLDTSCMDADFLSERPPEEERMQVNRGERDFSVRLIKSLFEDFNTTGLHENIFVSPSSIYQTLMLAYFGAAGDTQNELAEVMGTGNMTKDAIQRSYLFERAFQAVRERNPDLGYQLIHANKLYFDRQLPLSSCIQLILQDELGVVDFKKSEKVRQEINGWVSGKTQKKIPKLLPSGSFDGTTKLTLVNAAYFKGQWASKFDSDDTKTDNFYMSHDKITMTKYMKQTGKFNYYTSEELRAHVLQMPYEGEDVSMIIILPPFEEDSLYNTVQRLTPETLQGVMAEVRSGFYEVDDLNVEIPKFGIKQKLELSSTLAKLGTKSLFGSGSDLRNFLDLEHQDSDVADQLSLDAAVHQAFIEVNEEGSEAAAATALFGFRSARPLFHTDFIANHPFLFLIYDEKTDVILFFGVYQDPRS